LKGDPHEEDDIAHVLGAGVLAVHRDGRDRWARTGAGDGNQAGEPSMTQTTIRTQTQDDECQSGDCSAGEPTKTQAQTQLKSAECQADDCQAADALMAMEPIRERLINRLLEMLGAESAEAEAQYRHFLDNMLQKVLRLRLRVLFV
jgi:hypothetical protein